MQTEVSNQTYVVSAPGIELIDDKSAERMAIIKQPFKCAAWNQYDFAVAQRYHRVWARLIF